MAADCVRIERMLYFGRDFLCGLDPPVLKLKFTGPSLSEYVSVVDSSAASSLTSSSTKNGPHLLVSFIEYFIFIFGGVVIYVFEPFDSGDCVRPSPSSSFTCFAHELKKISGGSSCNLITNKKILKMMENEVGPIFILFRFVLPLLL